MSGGYLNPVPEGAGTRAHSGYASRLEIKLDETLKDLIIRNNGQPSNSPVFTEQWGAWMQSMHEDTLAASISQSYKNAHGIGNTLSESDDVNASKFIPSIGNVARMPIPPNVLQAITNANNTREAIVLAQKEYLRKQLSLVGVTGRAYYTGRVDGNNTSSTTGTFADYVCYKTLVLPTNQPLRPFEPIELDIFVGDGADGRLTVRNIKPDSIADAMKSNVKSYSNLYTKDNALTFTNIFEKGGAGNIFESNTTPIFGENEEIGQKFLLGGLALATKIMTVFKGGLVVSNGKRVGGANKGDVLKSQTDVDAIKKTLEDMFVTGKLSEYAPSFLDLVINNNPTNIPLSSFELEQMDGVSLVAQATAEEMCFHRPIGMMTNVLDSGTESGPYNRYDFVISSV